MSSRQHAPLRLRGRGRLVVVAAGALAAFARPASAQEGCVFGDEGNDLFVQRTIPGRGAVTYVTRPHFMCEDGVQIWADSAVAYQAERLSHLIGSVRYVDRTRELRADEARYFSDVGRLQAQGRVRVIDLEDGSVIENGDLVYLRVTDYRDEEVLTVSTGRDGVRPRATLPRDSGEPGAEPAAPYVVEGDRITLRGAESFTSAGDVVIERDSLLAFADSADYDEASELLVLVGSARVQGTSFDLVGRTIEIAEAEQGTSEVRALRDALLTGEDLRLRAPQVRLYLLDGALQRLVAVPLREEERRVVGNPEDADLARPVAVAEEMELTADSLELIAPDGEVERIFAVGRARSVSHARDSLNVESLPEIARSDWLEGDTIVVTLARVAGPAADADSAGAAGAGEDRAEYEVEQVVARVNARSLYRLLPEDSTARAGVDPPAVHYVVGSEITIYMRGGEVESMEVTGQTQGVHLEPLSRAPADDVPEADSLPADTLGVPANAPAPSADSVPAAGAPDGSPGLLGWAGAAGRSPRPASGVPWPGRWLGSSGAQRGRTRSARRRRVAAYAATRRGPIGPIRRARG